jgi:hypothetical protein
MKKLALLFAVGLFGSSVWAGITPISYAENLGQGNVSTITCSLAASTSGRMVAMSFSEANNRPISTIADTNGNTWATLRAVTTLGPVSIGAVGSTLTAGGATTITVTISGGTTGGSNAQCYEFSSTTGWPASASLLDVTCTNSLSSVSVIGCSANMTIAQNEELLINFTRTNAARTISPGTNFTQLAPNPAASQQYASVYRVTTTTGTYDAPSAWSDGAVNAVMIGFALKNTVAAGSPFKRRPVIIP